MALRYLAAGDFSNFDFAKKKEKSTVTFGQLSAEYIYFKLTFIPITRVTVLTKRIHS